MNYNDQYIVCSQIRSLGCHFGYISLFSPKAPGDAHLPEFLCSHTSQGCRGPGEGRSALIITIKKSVSL